MKKKKIPDLPRNTASSDLEGIVRKPIEWLSIFFGVSVFSIFFLSTACFFIFPKWSAPLWITINTLCVYGSFTMVHEASHRTLLRNHPFLNNVFGYIGAFLMHGSYYQFQLIHHHHHSFPNQEGRDPDLHCQGAIGVKTLLRWGATLYYYYLFFTQKKLGRMKENRVGLYLPYFIIGAIYLAAFLKGHLLETIAIWSLPAFFGTIITIFVFDYLPHHPHELTGRYNNARNLLRPKILTWISVMHTYHIVHHLDPTIAWYRYEDVYLKNRESLIARGIIEQKFELPIPVPLEYKPLRAYAFTALKIDLLLSKADHIRSMFRDLF